MIQVSVQVDIEAAIRFLNLLPKEAERAAARAINKVADEVKKDGAKEISRSTGISVPNVYKRMYVNPARANYLLAVVRALPSAKNVGYYEGAAPFQRDPGADVKAYGRRKVYDRAFVKGPRRLNGGIPRKVWRRTGPGKDDITDRTYGPSIRKEFMRPALRQRELELIARRWPMHFERYLRAELVRLRGAESLRGVKNVAPFLGGSDTTDQ